MLKILKLYLNKIESLSKKAELKTFLNFNKIEKLDVLRSLASDPFISDKLSSIDNRTLSPRFSRVDLEKIRGFFILRRSACILRDLLHGYPSLDSRLRTLSATCRRRGIRPSISRLRGRKKNRRCFSRRPGDRYFTDLPRRKTEEEQEEEEEVETRFRGASITVFGNFVLRRSELKKISPRVISTPSIPMEDCPTGNENRRYDCSPELSPKSDLIRI